MINQEALAAALDPDRDPTVRIDRVEFDVLDNGVIRWLLWEGANRIFCCTVSFQEMIEALQGSGVLLRTRSLVNQEAMGEIYDGPA